MGLEKGGGRCQDSRKGGSEHITMKRYHRSQNVVLQLFSSNFPRNMVNFYYIYSLLLAT